jgi:hypothetical protein
MYWVDGTVYKGYWERGMQNGYGKMISPTGDVKEGLFENGVFKVEGTEEMIRKKVYLSNE